MNKKLYIIFILLFVVLGTVLRLYKINGPVADWHSWRQADTAAVARNFIKFGFDPLHPRFDDLSNIPSGFDNPVGYRMVEFPIYQYISAGLLTIFHVWTIEIWLRIITVLASVSCIFFISEIVRLSYGKAAGVFTGFFYAVLPYAVYYGRSILPDQIAVCLSLLGIYSLLKAKKFFGIWYFVSIIATALALLVKPYSAFLLLPIPYILFIQWKISKKFFILSLVYVIISTFPLWWWRSWILAYPEGIPVYAWLLNANNIRFKGAWFRWLFAERLGNLILGYWGLVPFTIGILIREKNPHAWIIRLIGFGSLLYVTIIAAGNVQHDYYQIFLLPVITAFAGVGIATIVRMNIFSMIPRIGLALMSIIFCIGFSWYTIRTFYWINRPEIIEAGKMADKILPKNAKVIAPYNGDTTFLYQTNRQGWPIGFDIDKKKALGATHYVTVSPTDNDWETKELAEKYTVLVRNDTYAIIDITKPK
jgi:hypothetical protein